MIELTSTARNAIRLGSTKIRVVRSGMFQQLTFMVKKKKMGNVEYTELFTDRQVDMSELKRIANDVKLPVEAQNATAFPDGTQAQDFATPL